VKKIQEFEQELSEYRKENHELKRKLAIILEREESERLYSQELEKVNKNDNFLFQMMVLGEIGHSFSQKHRS